jgi:RNA polymerase sigma-70 factor (ECF subfamily)
MAELDEERAWIRRSQEGDHAAFEALVECYQRMIHSLTFRMTGSLADAEDLAQETFIQAFRQLAAYRGEAKFSSWLYRIAVNLCLNWKSREARQQKLLTDWGQQELNASGPEIRLTQEVQAALLSLHPKQRAAVVLTIYDGLSHAEAARVLRCSETTVSWRLFAARRKLKQLLGNAQRREEAHEPERT